jgi:hypothetical protein
MRRATSEERVMSRFDTATRAARVAGANRTGTGTWDGRFIADAERFNV